MGIVWRARDPLLGRTVAVKRIETRGALRPEMTARFRREARTAARLRHPGIVAVLEVGLDDGQPFLVAEYVEGRSLDRIGRLEVDAAVALVAAVARALAHAHEQGVVHRDVKPANILVDRDGRPRLTDFGLARFFDDPTATELTATGTVLGTPRYMSPEQVEGRRDAVGPASDQYGLGVVFYELLTGRPPFVDEDLRTLLVSILTKTPEPPRSIDPSIDPVLEAICLRTLAREPENRYPSLSALAGDLERHRAGRPVAGRPRPGRPAVVALAVAVALVALVAGGVGLARLGPDEEVAPGVEVDLAAAGRLLDEAEFLSIRPGADPAERMALVAEAEALLAPLGEAASADVRTRHLVGRAAAMAGRRRRAEQIWRGVLDDHPDDGPTRLDLAVLLLEGLLLDLEPDDAAGATSRRARAGRLLAGRTPGEAFERDRDEAYLLLARSVAVDRATAALDGFRARHGGRRGAEVFDLVDGALRVDRLRAGARATPTEVEAAISRFDDVLAARPIHPVARFARYRLVALLGGEPDPAELDRVLVSCPESERVVVERGLARLRAGDEEGAAADADRARALAPRDVDALILEGAVEQAAGRLETARARYDEALSIAPDDGEALRVRGSLRRLQGDLPGALADLDRSLELGADAARAHWSRALVRIDLGRLDEAAFDLDQAVGLLPREPELRVNRARLRWIRGDLDGALAEVDVALRLAPGRPQYLYERARIHVARGSREEARADLDGLVERFPREPSCRFQRALVRESDGDAGGALEDIAVCLEVLEPGDPRRAEVEAARDRLSGR